MKGKQTGEDADDTSSWDDATSTSGEDDGDIGEEGVVEDAW